MKNLICGIALTGLLALPSLQAEAQKPELIYTTPTERWVEAKKAIQVDKKQQLTPDIEVYVDQPLQTMDGIGGTFNEHGWDVLQTLDKKEVDKIIYDLFSEEGCNFSMGRIPVGANDYSLSYYSYCDVEEDFVMRDFNIDRDRYILIPYIKEALKLRPDLKMWASPWTPPAWMKINKHYSTKRGDWGKRTNGNRMPEGADVWNDATAFNMQERYLKAYALYFSKFAQAYAKEGVPLFAIMPQNEIVNSPNWPSCPWRPEDLAYFIGTFMGPQFEKDSLDTEIWLGTVNCPDPTYCQRILDNEKAASYIAGVGFQWLGAEALPTIWKEYPQFKYMQTENKCGGHENNWRSLTVSWENIVHYLNHGCQSYLYWNMVLDQTGLSSWGWAQNSMVIVDRPTGDVRYTDEFYLFKHLSHFVQPGAKLLKSSEGKNHLAFELTDGRLLVMVYNPEDKVEEVVIKLGETTLSTTLQPKSINSIVL